MILDSTYSRSYEHPACGWASKKPSKRSSSSIRRYHRPFFNSLPCTHGFGSHSWPYGHIDILIHATTYIVSYPSPPLPPLCHVGRRYLSTPAGAAACAAWVPPSTVGVEVVLPLNRGSVRPRQQVLEDCARVVKVLGPSPPGADVANGPPHGHRQILTPPATEGVGSVWPWVDVDIQQIVSKALQEGIGGLMRWE